MEPKPAPAINVPSAIIIAAAIIAIAIIYVKKPAPEPAAPSLPQTAEISMPAVTGADHIFGNPQASIKIVEYSDPSCPFCKEFHPTLKRILDEYGPTGKVAWVYRHFPLDEPRQDGFILHPNAGKEAESMECAAELGGNTKFWEYINKFYEVTPAVTQITPKGLDPAEIPQIAESVGLDGAAMTACISRGKYAEKIQDQYIDGINAGVSGTPYVIVITPAGTKIPLEGVVTYNTLRSTIETLLPTAK